MRRQLSTRGYMILGVGIDIIEVSRIQASFLRFGEKFLTRILHPNEIEYCLSHKTPAPFIAARFAAKEATSKAFGTGIGTELGWKNMEVGHQETGKPIMIFHAKGRDLLRSRRAHAVLISLSHTEIHAVAVAILESDL